MGVRSDVTRNAGGRMGMHSPLSSLANFQIHMPRTHNNTSNVTTPAVCDGMQF